MRELNPKLLENPGIGRDLDIEFTSVAPDKVVATMPVDERHVQPLGYLHGGVSVVLAESVASVGAWVNCEEGQTAFGTEINASHLRARRDGTLTATGVPLHRGGSSQTWQVEIKDERGRMVCVSRCSLAVVKARPEAGGS
ncbi:PaaI family thioesterase [Rubrobacter indicoceani]|uniref:PaaI family thioesterase n=1 Tax=Rubrobacter indicoceani TaxID=2051957 RepID=UPI000E5BB451|nr:hotdog fold thioesterase [Rubrobacter indicoceani]